MGRGRGVTRGVALGVAVGVGVGVGPDPVLLRIVPMSPTTVPVLASYHIDGDKKQDEEKRGSKKVRYDARKRPFIHT